MQPTPPFPTPALWWQMWVSGLFLCWQLLLDGYSVGFIFFSRLCYPLRFQNSTQARLWDGFLLFGSFSSCTTPSQGQVSIPNSLSLFLSFIFCPTSFWREWAAFLGDWCPLSAFRSLFCGSCSAFKWSVGEFVAEKVVSLFHFSTILGPPWQLPFFSPNPYKLPFYFLSLGIYLL